jgi:hypothetical protein
MAYPKSVPFVVLLFFLLGFLTELSAQEAGDYRSAGSGNWTDPGNWEVYDGTSWIPATTYPGQVGGTNLVTIQDGYTISLGSTIPNPIQGLIVGDGVGGTDTLEISNTATLNTPFIDLQTGGILIWTSNVSFFLPGPPCAFQGAFWIILGPVMPQNAWS